MGNALGFEGIAFGVLENSIANKYYWQTSKGVYKWASILKEGADGKFIRGVQGFRNSYASALKGASKFNVAGNVVGGIGIAVTLAQYTTGQISGKEAFVDTAFGIIGFFGPIGAAVSATYFLGKFAYEQISGETIFEKPN